MGADGSSFAEVANLDNTATNGSLKWRPKVVPEESFPAGLAHKSHIGRSKCIENYVLFLLDSLV